MNKIVFIILFVIYFLQSVVFAEQSLEERQRAYTLSLYKSGNYFQCIDEIYKGEFYWKRSHAESNYFILCNYFSGSQYLTVLHNLNNDYAISEMLRTQMLLSQTYLRLGSYNESVEAASLLSYAGSAQDRYKIFARRIEPLLYLENYDAIMAELETYKKMNDPYNGIAALEQALSSHNSIPHRNSTLAMVLSTFIPGAGQVYSGRYLDGILSLAGVAATTAGGLYLHHRGEKQLAGGMFFFAGLFYVGNIYGAYNSASEFNAKQNRIYRDDIRTNYLPSYEPTDYLNYGGSVSR